MADAGIKGAQLDELESHLRDDVSNQIRSGSIAEQAFEQAVERIGTAHTLKREFEKVQDVNAKRERLRRLSVIAGTGLVYSLLAVTWFIGVRRGKVEVTAGEIALALGAMIPMVGLGWAGRIAAKLLPVIHENWVVATAMVVLLGLATLLRAIFTVLSPSSLVHVQIQALWMLSPLLGFGNCVSAWHDRCAADRSQRRKVEA